MNRLRNCKFLIGGKIFPIRQNINHKIDSIYYLYYDSEMAAHQLQIQANSIPLFL